MPVPSDTLEVAVVGLGYWGPNRLRALGEIDDVEVTDVCDSDPDRLSPFAERHPHLRASRELGPLLARPELDAIVLATPVFTHHSLAATCLEAGKHVFVEKPLAASSDEAAGLIALARERGLTLMCGHTFLYSPAVRAIKRIIDAGTLGELHFISSSRVNLGPYRSDVSCVFDLGPHDFSILHYWLGRMPASVSARGRDVISENVADFAFCDLTFDDGLIAHVELSWLAPSKLRRTVIVGSRQMLVYEDGGPDPVRLYDSGIDYTDPHSFGEYQLTYRTGDVTSLRLDPIEPIVAELEDFVRSVRTGQEPVSSSEVAIDVLRTVEAAEVSLREGGAETPLARPVAGAVE